MSAKMIVAFALIAVAQAASLPQLSLVNRRAEQQPIRMSFKVENVNGKELATKTVAEGKSVTVEFELARRPDCASADHCFVRVLLENNRPDEVALSACYVEWDATEPEFCCANCDGKGIKKMCPYWMKKKQVQISTVEDFIDDGEKEILITTQPAVSKSEFFKGIDIPDIKIQTPDKGTAECSSTTDPNYKQFDGGRFTVNTAGTFSLWKAQQRDWEVQGRVDSRGMNCGLALRDGCDRIVFDRCGGGALSMRKFMDPKGDATLQPKISRDGDKTWIVTSRRSGAQVKVIHRVSIVRVGWTSCGWSGCRRSPINSVKEFLDFYLKTPGSDFGYMDSVTTDKTMPRITGVCGTWTKDRSDDLARVGTSTKLSAVQYAAQFKVTGTSLFDANPSVCKTTTPPVKIEPKQCSVVPRRIQKPVIGIFDIEDITELLKNSLEGEAEDEEDEASKYQFDLSSIKEPTRTDEFEREAMGFCKEVLLNSDVARRCLKMKVSGEAVDLDQWVRSCYQDIWWQDSGAPGDSTRHTLAASTHDSMENYCIDLRARNPEFSRACSAGEDCQQAGDICVGACTIKPVNDFKEMLAVRCPNSCGVNFRRDGAGGKCMQNAKGKNFCLCHSPDHWGGEDCTTEVGGVKPYISKLVPHTCDASKGTTCANEVVVHADTSEGTLFAKSDGVRCKVDGQVVNATFLDQTRIRCHLPEFAHAIGKPVHHRKVSVALDGKSFAQPLHFCHHDSSCTECVSRTGMVNIKKDTCHIQDMCHTKGAKGESLTKYHNCRVCDPSHSQTKWKYHYNHDDCAPKMMDVKYEVNEMHPLHRAINLNTPVSTMMNYNTRDDTENKPTFIIDGGSDIFSIEKDTGIIRLEDALDFEKAATHKLKIRATQGGLHSFGYATISVFDTDEGASFAQSEYTATVVENAPAGPLQGVNVSVTDPDGGATQYSLEVRGRSSSQFPFAIDANTGAVSTTKPLDFEERSKWPLVILAKSTAGSVARAYLTVAVTGVNEAPTFINLDTASVKENQPAGAKVANIEVTDPDAGDTYQLGLKGDAEAWFAIKKDENGKDALFLAKDGMDYEAMKTAGTTTLVFTIAAIDGQGEKFEMEQSIRVEDANDAPTTIKVNAVPTQHGAEDVVALTKIDETAEVGTVVAHLTVEDDDAGQTHGFRVLGDSPFAIADDNSLVLAKALDFESSQKVSVELVAYDNSDTNPLTSKKQEFTFDVVDGKDMPRDFTLVNSQIVPEMSAADTVVGTVEAVDQDMNEDFVIKADPAGAFAVGETTCNQVLGRGTVCNAQLRVSGNQAIDFEANRKTVHEAQLEVKLSADSADGESNCGAACPVVKISNAPDQPTGAQLSADGINDVTVDAATGVVVIEESADVLGALTAVDVDDACPLTIEGCADVSPSGAYTFSMVHDQFELAGACADAKPTAERVAGSSCSLRVKGGATLKAGDDHEVTIKVTDQDGLSTDHVQKVSVVKATLRFEIETVDGMLLTKNADGELEFAEQVFAAGWLPASRIKVAGWTSAEPVQQPTVVSGPFRLGTYSRRSRRGMTTQWTLEVDTAKLNVDANKAVKLELQMPGLTENKVFTFAVKQYAPEGAATQITSSGSVPRFAKKNADTASVSVTLSAFAAVGTEVAALTFSDEGVETVYEIEKQHPDRGMFAIVGGKLQTLEKPDAMSPKFGAGDSVEIDIQALQGGVVVNTFAIVVDVDYCTGNTQCGQCVECHSGPGGQDSCSDKQQTQQFMCVCPAGFTGAKCDRPIVESQLAAEGESGGSGDDSGMIAGIIVGVVVLIIIIAVVVVVAVMRTNTKNMEDQKESVYADVAKRDAAAQAEYDGIDLDEGALPARPDESYEAISNTVMDMSVSNPMYRQGGADNYAGYGNEGASQISNPNYSMDSSI